MSAHFLRLFAQNNSHEQSSEPVPTSYYRNAVSAPRRSIMVQIKLKLHSDSCLRWIAFIENQITEAKEQFFRASKKSYHHII